jgi:CubicO group peptidase (beta-lactamase class C family)
MPCGKCVILCLLLYRLIMPDVCAAQERNTTTGPNAVRGIHLSEQQSISLPKEGAILAWMQEDHVPTVGIGILQKGKVQQVKVFGNLKAHSPAPENTLFNMASLTKPIVSVLTLRLISQGKWQLDEPLYHYWTDPDVAADSRHEKLTTRHVLSHQSGLPNWRGHEPGGKLAFAFEPGTQAKYSGEGFEYLRQALERKFKIPIERLAATYVFKPCGMTDTRFYWDDRMDGSRYADRHHADGTPYPTETWGTANAANLLLATVKDYGQFGVAVMKGAGLSKEVYAETVKAQYPPKNGENAMSLGWRLVNGLSNGEYALVHTGRNPGVNTIIILLPKSQRGMIVFTNGDNGANVYSKIIGGTFPIGKEIVERIQ